jgi:REP element-mobilizing transposase RayT
MPRAGRRWLWTEAACYHLLNRGHARETLFHDDQDRSRFLELLARYRDRFDLRVYHYCLMDNHFHVLLQLADARKKMKKMGKKMGTRVPLVCSIQLPRQAGPEDNAS